MDWRHWNTSLCNWHHCDFFLYWDYLSAPPSNAVPVLSPFPDGPMWYRCILSLCNSQFTTNCTKPYASDCTSISHLFRDLPPPNGGWVRSVPASSPEEKRLTNFAARSQQLLEKTSRRVLWREISVTSRRVLWRDISVTSRRVLWIEHQCYLAPCSVARHQCYLAPCSVEGHQCYLAPCSVEGHQCYLVSCSVEGHQCYLAPCSVAGH